MQLMQILFITSEGFDTGHSTSHLAATLLEDIAKSGIDVYSITSHKTGEYEDIPDRLLKLENFRYSIIKRKIINKNNFVIRYLDELKYVFSAFKIWRKLTKEIDLVLIQSNPNSVFHAILLSIFMRKPIILNLYDVFPGHAMSIGVMNNKLIYNALRMLQKILYKKCKYIVAMSEDMKEELLTEKVPNEKVKVVRNWFDDTVFEVLPKQENKFFNKYNLDTNKFYIQFAGLLGYVFDYKMYLDVAERLKDEEDIVFLLIGDGNQKEKILAEIKERNVTNIKYFPWQPLNIISDVYNACDIGIIPLKKGVIGNGVPSKACQLMAAKRVILNSVEDSDYTKLFDDYKMGINVTNHNPETVAEAILDLKNNSEKCAELGENAYSFAYENYSRKKNTAQFVDLINKSIE